MSLTLLRHAVQKPPLGPVKLDLGHPLTQGLALVYLLREGSGPTYELGQSSASVPNANVVWTSTQHGVGLASLTAAISPSNFMSLGSDTALGLPTGPATALLGYRKRDGVSRVSGAFGSNNTGTGRFGAHLPYSDGVVYFDYGGSIEGTTRLSVSGLTFGDDLWAFSTGARGMEVWQNGIKRASNTANPTRSNGSTWGLFNHGQVGSDIAEAWLLVVWSRQLAPEAIQAVSAEPYAMFQARPLQKWFFGGPPPGIIERPATFLRHAVQKPPPGPLKLDLGHPLAQGLFAAYPFNEGGGQVVGDALGNYPLSYSTATTDFSWQGSPFGGGLDSANAADGNVFLSKIGTIFSGTSQPLSIAAFAWCRSVPNSAARIIGLGDASAATLNYMGVHHQGGGTGCWFPNSTAIFGANMISTTPKWFLVVGTWDGTTPQLYDGLLGQTPTLYTSTSANTAPTSADHIELANRRLGGARNWNGQIGPAYIWTRALSADEIHQLSAEPYAMFQTRPVQKWFVVPAPRVVTRPPLRHAVQKPPVGPLKLDTGHPLSQGLLSAFAISEVGSQVLNDAVGPFQLTASGTTKPTWAASPYGPAVDSTGSTNNTMWQSATLSSGVPYSGITLAAIGMQRGGNTNGRILTADDGSAGAFLQLYIGNGQVTVQTTGGSILVSPSQTNGAWYLYAATYTSTGSVGYYIPLGGGAIVSGSSALTGAPTIKRLTLGNRWDGVRNWDGQFAAAFAWTRALSQAELQQVAAEPYAMFQTRPLQQWFVTSNVHTVSRPLTLDFLRRGEPLPFIGG